MNDTSKRKRTEETLSNPELFFRQVIENAGGVPFQLIFGSSLGTGYYKYIGTGIKNLIGVLPNEFTEKLFNSLVEVVNPLLPEIPIDPTECRRKMVKGDIPHYKADILIRSTKGEAKWINESSLPIRDEKTGKIIGAQGILIDIDKHKKIEKEKEQNISLLRATLESTADGILVVDSSGKISDFNNQFAQMWRIPDAILATHDDKQAIDFVLDQLKDPKSFISNVKDLYANPEKESYDMLEFKDGRLFERFSHPQKIAGKPVGRVWSFRDITERKRAEEALRKSEEEYRGLTENINLGIYRNTVGHEGKFIEANPAIIGMFGYKNKEEFLAINVSDLYQNPEDRNMFNDKMLKEGFVRGKELWLKKKDGSLFVGSVSAVAVRDKQGHVKYYDGIIDNITERKRAEEALKESEIKYRTLIDMTGTGYLILDSQGRVLDANQEYVRLSGHTKLHDILGKSVIAWTAEGRKQRNAEAVAQCAKNGFIRDFVTEYVDGGGKITPIEINASVDGEGESLRIVSLCRDITERKRVGEALRESEERYRSLFDRMMDGVYRSTHEGKFVDVNEAMVKMFGFSSKEEMLKVDIKKELYFAPSERDSLFLDTGQEKIEVFRMRRKDGSEIWVEDHGRYVHDEQGNVIFHEGILRNVTERLRNEVLQNAIYQISQGADKAFKLDDLFKSVHQIISTVMPAKNFYISLYDKEKDLISFPYFVDEVDISPPPVNPGKGLTAYVLRTSKPLLCDEATDMKLRQQGEVELVGALSSIWLGVPLIVSNKTIGVMVVQHYSDPYAYNEQDLHMLEYVSSQVARAIEQKRAEEKLRQSEEQFRLISENVADLIAVLDLNGKRLYTSPSYKDILGDPQSLRGTDSFQEIHPEDRDRIKQIFQETVKTGVGKRAEYRFLLKNGAIRQIESQGSVIKDKDGKISQIIVVSRDVTEKKILELQFLRSQRMESIGTLAGGIAHDLNNVLAPIVMAIDILRKKNPDKTSQQILDSLESSAQRGADIVKQVLAFARGIEGDRLLLQPKHIISEIVKIIKETFPRSIDIRTEVPKILWTISADPTQMHQVLLNVCVNARDAMLDGGKLTISAENIFIDENYSKMHSEAKVGPTVMITISDTGMGIPSKILDKIFEPFFTTKEMGKGTGLGLSTVHAIVKSHGGFINVYSEVAKGTTFKIYFPASMKDQVTSAEMIHPTLPQGSGELVLIVDDEASIRDITKSTLEANGYNVMTANDGTDAISLYAQNREIINVVISDIMMPVMDGTVTIRALQKMNPKIKIIAASGLITSDVKNLGTNVQAFLTKPFSAEKLLITLHKVLSSK
jgi:PAS domain S-box-containing protein